MLYKVLYKIALIITFVQQLNKIMASINKYPTQRAHRYGQLCPKNRVKSVAEQAKRGEVFEATLVFGSCDDFEGDIETLKSALGVEPITNYSSPEKTSVEFVFGPAKIECLYVQIG